MKYSLSPHEKRQLWQQYQAQKQHKKKPDPHLKRDLKHGWLFPYLTQTENLMWGRWQYWQECQHLDWIWRGDLAIPLGQMLPEVAWQRWKWEQAIANSFKLQQSELRIALISQRLAVTEERIDYTSNKKWTNYITNPVDIIQNLFGGGMQRDNIALPLSSQITFSSEQVFYSLTN